MSASGLKTDVSDSTVTRYRPTVLIADENMVGSVGKQRAEWERQRNNAEGKRSTATVQGWTKPDGSLWLPNELIKLNAPQLGINGEERLIVDCNYKLDGSGTITVLTLMHREAFDEPPEPIDAQSGSAGSKTGKSKTKKSGSSSGGVADEGIYTNQGQQG